MQEQEKDVTLDENGFAFFAWDYENSRLIDRHLLGSNGEKVIPYDIDVRDKTSWDKRWLYVGSKRSLVIAKKFITKHLPEISPNAEARIIEAKTGKVVERVKQ